MILGVAGYQNSGKTTFLELAIPHIVAAGFTVATVKHIAHDDLQIDPAGTDTERHKRAGARLAVAVSDSETVFFQRGGISLESVLSRLEKFEPADLVLVEGFKMSDLPKIVIGQVEHGGPARYRWDGTPAGALQIAQAICAEIRAQRAAARKETGEKGARRAPGRRSMGHDRSVGRPRRGR